MKKNINNIFRIMSLSLALTMSLTSCNDWLDVKPNNERVTEDYWIQKEDVEEVVNAGYKYMRDAVPLMIKWGELRGGAIYSGNTVDQKLQDFNMTPSHSICNWSNVYKIINMANSVILYAPKVQSVDDTYYDAIMKSHLCEAYFQRAYCYLLLAKNFREAPLIVDAYVTDEQEFDQPKSSEAEILAQVKADVKAALETGAAKTTYEIAWQTKGRATKWALYALMADAALWTEDYDECIKYCDMILNATDAFRPAFVTNPSEWYTIFYPESTGQLYSNESIFELFWSYSLAQESNNFSTSLFAQSATSQLRFTSSSTEKMRKETQELVDNGFAQDGRMGRMLLATYVPSTAVLSGWSTSTNYYLWKYYGNDIPDITGGVRTHQDANFILYRMAEIILMKAQAETMRGNFKDAIALINKIRNRAGLTNFNDIDIEADDADGKISQLSEQTILEEILDQKEMEFMAEGKRWYDLLWYGRIKNNKYKNSFIDKVIEGNETTNPSWIRSVLNDVNAWYMPVPQSDIDHNKLLEQNPYYSTKK